MKEVKYFDYMESSTPNKYIITYDPDKGFPITYTSGSFAVLPARLMNLTYPDYLRLCRDEFGAEIIGKNSDYPIAYFPKSKNLFQFIHLLNSRAAAVKWEQEELDSYKEKVEYLRKNYPQTLKRFEERNGEIGYEFK